MWPQIPLFSACSSYLANFHGMPAVDTDTRRYSHPVVAVLARLHDTQHSSSRSHILPYTDANLLGAEFKKRQLFKCLPFSPAHYAAPFHVPRSSLSFLDPNKFSYTPPVENMRYMSVNFIIHCATNWKIDLTRPCLFLCIPYVSS